MSDDAVLRSEAPLDAGLAAAAERGWAHVPDAVDAGWLEALTAESEGGEFRAAPAEVGEVYQEVEGYVLTPEDDAAHPQAAALRDALEERARAAAADVEGLDAFTPNEVHVQRYPAGGTGITPHRDGSRFRPLIVVLTARGRARFTIHRERHGPAVDGWDVEPGDLVVLRGPGLGGVDDGRPLHAVSGPGDEPRYSVSVRRNARAGEGERHFR